MKMTPLDIRQKRFEQKFRGYSQKEVLDFLESVASEFEEVVRETISLKDDARRLQAQVDRHVEKEQAFQEMLLAAQKVSQDVKDQAKKEAEVVLAQAELQGEKIVAHANNRLAELIREINELKRQKVQFTSQVESMIESHKRLLETYTTEGGEVSFLVQRSGEPAV